MNRHEFEHTVRAAGAILGTTELLVIGTIRVRQATERRNTTKRRLTSFWLLLQSRRSNPVRSEQGILKFKLGQSYDFPRGCQRTWV